MKKLVAVILDIDGTLVYSNDAHARAFIEAGERLGFSADYDEVRRLIGMGGDKLIPRAFGFEQDSDEGERLEQTKGEIFRERHLPHLLPTPGARALLERLRAEGLKLVIATSAQEKDLKGLLERAGVSDLIDESTSAGDVEETKPSPDPLEAALEEADCAADEALMLGDTPYDVEAAGRAGVGIVGVRSGGWGDEDLTGALAVYDHPAHLLAEFERSPFRRQ